MDKTNIYIELINKVIDYIDQNLENEISLDELTSVSGLSKFHFHRIFQSFVNESLYSFITRLRIERAASLLLTQNVSITDIAFACGFNDSATFSRAFKKHFNISATSWKKNKNSKIHQDSNIISPYNLSSKLKQESRIKPVNVDDRYLPEMTIVYVRHTGKFSENYSLFEKLFNRIKYFGETQGIYNDQTSKSLIIYHDSLGITDCQKLRISVGLITESDIDVGDDIGKMVIEKKRYTICRYVLKNGDYGKAWTQVYREIIPQRGLQPDDGYCFELYRPNCYNTINNATTVEICVPVKKL